MMNSSRLTCRTRSPRSSSPRSISKPSRSRHSQCAARGAGVARICRHSGADRVHAGRTPLRRRRPVHHRYSIPAHVTVPVPLCCLRRATTNPGLTLSPLPSRASAGPLAGWVGISTPATPSEPAPISTTSHSRVSPSPTRSRSTRSDSSTQLTTLSPGTCFSSMCGAPLLLPQPPRRHKRRR